MGITCLKAKLAPSRKLSPKLKKLKRQLKKAKNNQGNGLPLTNEDQRLAEHIQEMTSEKNRNNVTRTQAYLAFYQKYPEIRWAFLGHIVSRNGGWNMTDLRGDLLSRLLTTKQQAQFFDFLERGNWLIFHDVYPQMLLYEESIKRQTNMFYLLPRFGVSTFMSVIWNEFLKSRDQYMLAIALVINEQNYLEQRVIQNDHYQETVLETMNFKIQELFSLNQILMPYQKQSEIKVIGQSINQFSSVHERIMLGKRLYELLFDGDVYERIFTWACRHPHTGSRRDYWSSIFHDINESVPGEPFVRRTKNCQLRPGAKRIYSPRLTQAWADVDHHEAEVGDWFDDWRVLYYLQKNDVDVDGEVYEDYCQTLEKIELAIIAKETFVSRA
ncbi:DUF2515 domain-containing protein [Desertibacillus haloalkaliphilus]|uniref:DUF2515 domain-containing protein n=1 Tax=Desertibacillus haloalkaliphilus TaxID=1328930 RepID=UPI001C25C102|nr:DUF2515 domain-containing protein [Desertibacillus haloalkaliphilus]MBU8907587.1 DUF2515 domain-containing protein [Desertibacillus haloalkaliphilus]